MSLEKLNNLVKIGQLKKEPFNFEEFSGLFRSGKARLKDANNIELAMESRFDLAYNSAHALSLAALRWRGYRPKNRYIVFEVLPETIQLEQKFGRVLAKCHAWRNAVEYEGEIEVNEQLLKDLLTSTQELLNLISWLYTKLQKTNSTK